MISSEREGCAIVCGRVLGRLMVVEGEMVVGGGRAEEGGGM